jgi:hypothetical protein
MPETRSTSNSSDRRSGIPARHRAVETRLRFDVPPMSGKYARPTILRVSRQNRIHPSGETMMLDNLLFFPWFRCFREDQPRNLGLLLVICLHRHCSGVVRNRLSEGAIQSEGFRMAGLSRAETSAGLLGRSAIVCRPFSLFLGEKVAGGMNRPHPPPPPAWGGEGTANGVTPRSYPSQRVENAEAGCRKRKNDIQWSVMYI